MTSRKTVSVCLAAYNGDKYLKPQLDSILIQLEEQDEVIIIDDCSSDLTKSIIQEYSARDLRVKFFVNSKNLGVNKTFERAIHMSSGDYIFLADQDDVWLPNRVDNMMSSLMDSDKLFLSSNFEFIDGAGNFTDSVQEFALKGDSSDENVSNVIKLFFGRMSYYGCAMCFKKEFKKYILPFPNFIDSHDLWLAMVANIERTCIHDEKASLLRRIHGNNLSVVTRALSKKIYSRCLLLGSFLYYFLNKLVSKT